MVMIMMMVMVTMMLMAMAMMVMMFFWRLVAAGAALGGRANNFPVSTILLMRRSRISGGGLIVMIIDYNWR